MPTPKQRFRPPNLSMPGSSTRPLAGIHVDSSQQQQLSPELSSPSTPSSPSSELQLSSPSSFGSSPNSPPDSDPHDDMVKDLRALEQLRRNVQQNLRLRPIRSNSNLPKVNLTIKTSRALFSPDLSIPGAWKDFDVIPESAASTSSFYTPLSVSRSSPSSPMSARFIGGSNNWSFPLDLHTPKTPSPRQSQAIEPSTLPERLTAVHRPLVIDARSPAAHAISHIRNSINIAIPSLILKRCRKPAHVFQSLDSLRQFITNDASKAEWDQLLAPGGMWDGDVIVYDDEMDVKDKDNLNSPAWSLLPIITPLLLHGTVDYLQGGYTATKTAPSLRTFIVTDDSFDNSSDDFSGPKSAKNLGPGGLFQLDTQAAHNAKSKSFPEIEQPGHSPLPTMPSALQASPLLLDISDSSPSPPPSQVAFRRPPPPRRPPGPNLRKIDTSSTERLNADLPKLQVPGPKKRNGAQNLSVPPISLSLHLPSSPKSPSHLNLKYSSHSPPGSARAWPTSSPTSASDFVSSHYTSYFTPPHTPLTPMPPTPSPQTARPEGDQPPTTDDSAIPVFAISTILPNFLYLGPELTSQEHVEELQALGVKVILNLAQECDADDHGLKLRNAFEKYVRIPMRDTVEEENIAQGVRKVCEILDDARLHSSATYVHCKAGKSRSVTAVMAYLIHANHWTLSRAYAFVLERRKGISPNIGFVSELMTFEEQELGGKSVGVQHAAAAGGAKEDSESDLSDNEGSRGGGGAGGGAGFGAKMNGNQSYLSATQSRRPGHIRESLPPMLHSASAFEGTNGFSGGPPEVDVSRVGDWGQETEIKDKEGRYRHLRRAPVSEATLQPLRRVSKAGLESAAPLELEG